MMLSEMEKTCMESNRAVGCIEEAITTFACQDVRRSEWNDFAEVMGHLNDDLRSLKDAEEKINDMMRRAGVSI